NGTPEEKSWSDCGPKTLLWGLLNDFLPFRRRHLFEDLRNCASPAFGSDNYAGVEDHSHAGGSHGLRFLMISSTSAAKSESIDDDLCLGAHWGHHTGQSRWRLPPARCG